MIDEELFSSRLDTVGIPDPDFLIRTSGEMRISNFLLWQMAYAELYFCNIYWPDFDKAALESALAEFGRRKRRFGLTSEQLQQEEPGQEGGARH
jgi:undecaprenyl diphosphate synthase